MVSLRVLGVVAVVGDWFGLTQSFGLWCVG